MRPKPKSTLTARAPRPGRAWRGTRGSRAAGKSPSTGFPSGRCICWAPRFISTEATVAPWVVGIHTGVWMAAHARRVVRVIGEQHPERVEHRRAFEHVQPGLDPLQPERAVRHDPHQHVVCRRTWATRGILTTFGFMVRRHDRIVTQSPRPGQTQPIQARGPGPDGQRAGCSWRGPCPCMVDVRNLGGFRACSPAAVGPSRDTEGRARRRREHPDQQIPAAGRP
jgi:hypothetical protein